MNPNEIGLQWQKLCEEAEVAQRKALISVPSHRFTKNSQRSGGERLR